VIEQAAKGSQGPRMEVRLYIAEATPNSMRAQANLRSVLEELNIRADQICLEIIDVFSAPRRALIDGVIVTPTLVASHDAKTSMIVGDLSNRAQLAAILKAFELGPSHGAERGREVP
jgi:circadian clock protein KaiB